MSVEDTFPWTEQTLQFNVMEKARVEIMRCISSIA